MIKLVRVNKNTSNKQQDKHRELPYRQHRVGIENSRHPGNY